MTKKGDGMTILYVIPVKTGIQIIYMRHEWIPACAGMTKRNTCVCRSVAGITSLRRSHAFSPSFRPSLCHSVLPYVIPTFFLSFPREQKVFAENDICEECGNPKEIFTNKQR
jgi:hypothetical protein